VCLMPTPGKTAAPLDEYACDDADAAPRIGACCGRLTLAAAAIVAAPTEMEVAVAARWAPGWGRAQALSPLKSREPGPGSPPRKS
jgi:hypothetical protein